VRAGAGAVVEEDEESVRVARGEEIEGSINIYEWWIDRTGGRTSRGGSLC
jgi:hypothetical protein